MPLSNAQNLNATPAVESAGNIGMREPRVHSSHSIARNVSYTTVGKTTGAFAV